MELTNGQRSYTRLDSTYFWCRSSTSWFIMLVSRKIKQIVCLAWFMAVNQEYQYHKVQVDRLAKAAAYSVDAWISYIFRDFPGSAGVYPRHRSMYLASSIPNLGSSTSGTLLDEQRGLNSGLMQDHRTLWILYDSLYETVHSWFFHWESVLIGSESRWESSNYESNLLVIRAGSLCSYDRTGSWNLSLVHLHMRLHGVISVVSLSIVWVLVVTVKTGMESLMSKLYVPFVGRRLNGSSARCLASAQYTLSSMYPLRRSRDLTSVPI